MKVSDEFEQVRKFRSYCHKIKRTLAAPFEMLYRKGKQTASPNGMLNKVSEDVREEVRDIAQKPRSIEEYFLIGKHYVARKLLYIVGIFFMFFLIFVADVGYPKMVSLWFTKTMMLNDIAVSTYTGKVKLINNYDEKRVIFAGRLNEGSVEGEGTLYDYSGHIVYRGNFKEQMYEGEGILYHANGKVRYRGGFLNNRYEGEGVLYNAVGQKVYEGGFSQGI